MGRSYRGCRMPSCEASEAIPSNAKILSRSSDAWQPPNRWSSVFRLRDSGFLFCPRKGPGITANRACCCGRGSMPIEAGMRANARVQTTVAVWAL
ncbi:hypothetical protein HYQ44_004850 [Verticillium longisporum]|nr:hypothetical protein HYQ44_004850 [Verticillium longisporum]